MLAEPTVVIYGIEGYTPAVEPPLRRRLKEMERREDLLKVQWRILREEGRLIVIIMHLKERDVRPLARRFEGEINSLMEERGERCRLKMMLTATITRPIPTPEDQYLLERFYRIVQERREKPLDGSRSTPEGVGEEGLLIIYYLYMLGRREEREVVEDLYPIFQLEPSEVKRILEVLLEKGLVRREGERYRLTWEGLSLIEELSSELFALAEKEVNLEITRYLPHRQDRGVPLGGCCGGPHLLRRLLKGRRKMRKSRPSQPAGGRLHPGEVPPVGTQTGAGCPGPHREVEHQIHLLQAAAGVSHGGEGG